MRLRRTARRGPAAVAIAALALSGLALAAPAAAVEAPDVPSPEAPVTDADVLADTVADAETSLFSGHHGGWGHRPVRPIRNLDLERYQGRWLQLAAIPEEFSAFCERDTQANYTILPDGLVEVINSCVTAGGFPVEIEGRARVVGPDSNAQLEVTFARDDDGEFVFDGAGDYWVIGLDRKGYEWAVVGNGERSSGFVLSREPVLTGREISRIVFVLLRNGYNPCDFEITATTGGVEENRPFCKH